MQINEDLFFREKALREIVKQGGLTGEKSIAEASAQGAEK